MVEPEVIMDGDHDIDVCYEVTEVVLRSLFAALYDQNVMLEGTILKASMVVSGKDCPEQASVEEVAELTVRCLKSTVPANLPGIVFLSGGQSDEAATAHLNAMNQMGPLPWPLSFSYGRAMAVGRAQAVVAGHRQQRRRRAEDRARPRPRQRLGRTRRVGQVRLIPAIAETRKRRRKPAFFISGPAPAPPQARSAARSAMRRSMRSRAMSATVFRLTNSSSAAGPIRVAPRRIARWIGSTRR